MKKTRNLFKSLWILMLALMVSLVFSISVYADDTSVAEVTNITGLPTEYTIKIGEKILWDPSPEGGKWLWDATYLDCILNGSKIRVEGKQEGIVQMTYITEQYAQHKIVVQVVAADSQEVNATNINLPEDTSSTSSSNTSSENSQTSSAVLSENNSSQSSSTESVLAQNSQETSSALSQIPSSATSNTQSQVANPASGVNLDLSIVIVTMIVMAICLAVIFTVRRKNNK